MFTHQHTNKPYTNIHTSSIVYTPTQAVANGYINCLAEYAVPPVGIRDNLGVVV